MVKVICHNYGNDCDFEVQGNIEEVAEKYNYHSEQKHGIEYSKEILEQRFSAVSYTHLTLPTIYSV